MKSEKAGQIFDLLKEKNEIRRILPTRIVSYSNLG